MISNKELCPESLAEVEINPIMIDEDTNVVLGKRNRDTKLEEVFYPPKM